MSLRIALLPWLLLPLVALGGGCTPRPRAPALVDSSVYANDQEGFRFLVPDGWVQLARMALPPGPVRQERLLVLYRCFATTPPSTLEVSVLDLSADADLSAYLHDHPWSGQTWQVASSTPVKAGSRDGQRFVLEPATGPATLAREEVVVRRGERIYLFNGIFPPRETTQRDQLRQLVAGLHWK